MVNNNIEPPLIPSEPEILPPPQENNPTTFQRHNLLRYSLRKAGRPEDFDNIVRLLSPPADITTICVPGSCKGIKME